MKRKVLLIFIILFGLLLTTPKQNKANADTTPIALWHMDEGSGNSILDPIGGNNGTLHGTVSWVPGVSGKNSDHALQFNGGWSDYVVFNPTLNVTNEMTVETWINPSFDPTNLSAYNPVWPCAMNILRKAYYEGTFGLQMVGGCGYYASPYLTFWVLDAGGGYHAAEQVSVSGLMQKGQWHQLTGTYKSGDAVKLYVDGVLKISTPVSNQPIRTSASPLVMGQISDIDGGESYWANESWKGLIDDTAIYGNALTSDEVLQHYYKLTDTTAPTISITTPADGTNYQLNQSVASNYACTDSQSGVASCTGPVANGSPFDTSSAGIHTFTVNATDNAGNSGSKSANYNVVYNICAQYDQTKAVKSGATVPVKLQLCDVNNNNVSASNIVVHGTNITQVSTSLIGTLEDSGNANPDNDFRYDSTLGGYIYNLSTKGLATGTYAVNFIAGNDPSSHSVQFEVK